MLACEMKKVQEKLALIKIIIKPGWLVLIN